MVARTSGHKFAKCDDEQCEGCLICEYAIRFCRVCGGSHSTMGSDSLPTNCPGKPMTKAELHAIHYRQIDYINGSWITLVDVAGGLIKAGATIAGVL